MKIFSIYLRSNHQDKIDDLKVIKSGFSFYAFIFGALWFLYHKMWFEFAFLFAINLLLMSFSSNISSFDFVIIELVLSFFIGLNANYWYCLKLAKNKYNLFNIIMAKNKDEVCFKIFKEFSSKSLNIKEFDDEIFNIKDQNNFVCKLARFFKAKDKNHKIA